MLKKVTKRKLDGKGPEGKGPRTGKGLGDCKPEVVEEVVDPKDALIGTKLSGKTVISVVSETDKRYLVAMSDGTTIHIIK